MAAAAPDGRGGWFIAGSFTHLDGVSERGIAHVLADGTIDPHWHGTLASSGRSALVAAGNTLYAAGSIGDTDRSRVLVALDAINRCADGDRSRRRRGRSAPWRVDGTRPDRSRHRPAPCVRDRAASRRSTTGSGRPQSAFAADIRPAPEQGCIGAMRLHGASLYIAGAFARRRRRARGPASPSSTRRRARLSSRLESAWPRDRRHGLRPRCRSAGGGGDCRLAPGADGAVDRHRDRRRRRWRAPGAIRNPLSLAVIGDELLVAGDFSGGVARLRLATGAGLPSWRAAPGQSGGPVVASGSSALVGIHRH